MSGSSGGGERYSLLVVDIRETLEGDLSHSITHLLNELGVALSDGEIADARARLAELRESYHALLREIAGALDG